MGSTSVIYNYYLITQVFQEVLRLYPPAPAVSKQAFSGLKLGNFSIPSGLDILVSLYTVTMPMHYATPIMQ